MPRTVWLALVVRAIAYPPLIGGMIIIGLGAGLLNGETTKVGMTVIPRHIRGQHGGKTMSLTEIGPEIGWLVGESQKRPERPFLLITVRPVGDPTTVSGVPEQPDVSPNLWLSIMPTPPSQTARTNPLTV